MPDEAQTIPLEEHKKLQRKFNRRDGAARKAEEKVESLEAGLSRVEALVEGLTTLLVQGDDGLRSAAIKLIEGNGERRKADTTSAQLGARLNQLVDSADEDWEDPKFNPARLVLDSINETGDLGRAPEVERLINEALHPTDSRSLEERVAEAVGKALHQERTGKAKVDTGETTAFSGPVSRASLARLDPRKGITEIRKQLDQAYEQLGVKKE